MKTIAIVDYGMSNLHSVDRAFRLLAPSSWRVQIADTADEIEAADKVVFPGQGAARDCMKALAKAGIDKTLVKAADEKPFLGICMGMQVLFEHSEENDGTECLGLLAGDIRHLSTLGGARPGHKIPHLGWNRVRRSDHPLWHGVGDAEYFYFAHSYYAHPADDDAVAGTTRHGGDFASSVARGRIFAVQFHPEKSADAGLRVLKNFIHWDA